jgi:hypothetical protein
MARKEKYYGTLVIIIGNQYKKLIELGYKGYHNQFRVVCKAKSIEEANRIAESYNLGSKVFRRDYTCETGNALEIELADKYGFIIDVSGSFGRKYIDIKEINK